MIEAKITGMPRVYFNGFEYIDGKPIQKKMLSVLAKTLISEKDNIWQEFLLEYSAISPFPAMYVKKGDTVFVDGKLVGFQRLGGGSIARNVKRVAVSEIVTPSVTEIKEHNCWCNFCIRKN